MNFSSEFPIVIWDDFGINFFDIFLKFFLITSVLAFIPGQSLFLFEQKYFHFSIILLTFAAIISNPVRSINNWNLLIGFNFIFLINCILHGFNSYVMNYTLNIFLFSFLIILIFTYCNDWGSCVKYIKAGFLLNCIPLAFQLNDYGFGIESYGINSGGLMGNIARLSFFACILIPLSGKLFSSLIIVACGLVYPQYCIYVIFLIVLWFEFPSKNNRIFIISTLVSVFFLILHFKYQSILTRFDCYVPIIKDLFLKFPISGYGAGIKFTEILGVARDNQIYSSILQLFFTTGIVSILWFFIAIKKFYKNFNYNKISYSILAFLIISIWEYPFEVKRLWFILAALISFYLIDNEQQLKIKVSGVKESLLKKVI